MHQDGWNTVTISPSRRAVPHATTITYDPTGPGIAAKRHGFAPRLWTGGNGLGQWPNGPARTWLGESQDALGSLRAFFG